MNNMEINLKLLKHLEDLLKSKFHNIRVKENKENSYAYLIQKTYYNDEKIIAKAEVYYNPSSPLDESNLFFSINDYFIEVNVITSAGETILRISSFSYEKNKLIENVYMLNSKTLMKDIIKFSSSLFEKNVYAKQT